ncbi:hypothetical protein GCM10009760_60590 [Kitasatospora kazusensis]|uniref:Uncharacterized protein n=1 Tax=Kitasatospora kazusensis TaxID=407974 RepID=A0ABN3AAR0_9ACTN
MFGVGKADGETPEVDDRVQLPPPHQEVGGFEVAVEPDRRDGRLGQGERAAPQLLQVCEVEVEALDRPAVVEGLADPSVAARRPPPRYQLRSP